jgi:hypothetical protein
MRLAPFVVASLSLAIVACSGSRPPAQLSGEQTDQSPTQVAESELKSVQKPTSCNLLGLGAPEEAGKATLGKPLRVYFANSNEVSNYTGGDLSKILHETDNVVFPVLVDGKARLLIEVGNQGGKWKPLRDGYQDSASSLVASEEVPGENAPTASIFIRLPSMNDSNVVLTGKMPSPAPGASSDSIPVPDLNSVLQVVQLNGRPLASSEPGHVHVKVDHPHWILKGAYGIYGSQTPSSAGPGGPPTNPAQDFFKAIAPAAKEVSTQSEHGPA